MNRIKFRNRNVLVNAWLIGFCILLAVLFIGCSGKARTFTATGDSMHFVYITRDLRNDYWYDVIEGIETGLHDGDTLEVFDSGFDPEKEKTIVDEIKEMHIDGVFYTSADYSGSEKIISELLKTDVPVIVIDAPSVVRDKADYYIETDKEAAGAISMEALAQALGGEGKILIVKDDANSERVRGARNALNEYPGITVADECSIDGMDAYQIRMAVRDAVAARQDLSGIWFVTGLASDNGIMALENTELLVADARSYDSSYYLIEDGSLLATMFDDPIEHGAAAIRTMYGCYEQKTDERYVKVAPVLLNRENIKDFVTE